MAQACPGAKIDAPQDPLVGTEKFSHTQSNHPYGTCGKHYHKKAALVGAAQRIAENAAKKDKANGVAKAPATPVECPEGANCTETTHYHLTDQKLGLGDLIAFDTPQVLEGDLQEPGGEGTGEDTDDSDFTESDDDEADEKPNLGAPPRLRRLATLGGHDPPLDVQPLVEAGEPPPEAHKDPPEGKHDPPVLAEPSSEESEEDQDEASSDWDEPDHPPHGEVIIPFDLADQLNRMAEGHQAEADRRAQVQRAADIREVVDGIARAHVADVQRRKGYLDRKAAADARHSTPGKNRFLWDTTANFTQKELQMVTEIKTTNVGSIAESTCTTWGKLKEMLKKALTSEVAIVNGDNNEEHIERGMRGRNNFFGFELNAGQRRPRQTFDGSFHAVREVPYFTALLEALVAREELAQMTIYDGDRKLTRSFLSSAQFFATKIVQDWDNRGIDVLNTTFHPYGIRGDRIVGHTIIVYIQRRMVIGIDMMAGVTKTSIVANFR